MCCSSRLPNGEVLPGLMTDRGVVDISGAVKKGYTPQLTMQGIIDGFDRLKPALEKLAAEGKAVPADTGAAQAAAAAARQNPLLHRQLLGARPARGAAAQHVHEEPRRRGRPGRHHHAAGIHRALGVHARGRAGAGDQGPGQDGEGRRTGAERRVRLHPPDRRVGARAGPPHLAGDAADELARQVVRHLRADRPLHRHRRRDQGPERPDRAVLERRPAAPQLQHRRHGAPRPRADRVGHHGDDA